MVAPVDCVWGILDSTHGFEGKYARGKEPQWKVDSLALYFSPDIGIDTRQYREFKWGPQLHGEKGKKLGTVGELRVWIPFASL